MGYYRKFCKKLSAPHAAISFAALAVLFACLIKSAAGLSLSPPGQSPDKMTPIAAERWPPGVEQIWISYHVDMPEGISFHKQHLHQEALAALLMNDASQLPSIRQCDLKVRFLDLFGDFAIGIRHPNPERRVDCLRGAVGYLLRQNIGEFSFLETRKSDAYWERMGFSSQIYAQQSALLTIYQKYSPLYQVHSTGPKDLSDISYDEFDRWLRRSRERNLITFGGKTALLDSLGLPVPDPMVLRPVPSLKSPRVPAGVLFLESEKAEVPALVMINLDDAKLFDSRIADRLSCNAGGPTRLGAASAGGAISKVSCQMSNWFGDVWLSLAVGKSDGASYQDFCRQTQELTEDAILAAVVRASPERSKGLYVLLPPKCEPLQ